MKYLIILPILLFIFTSSHYYQQGNRTLSNEESISSKGSCYDVLYAASNSILLDELILLDKRISMHSSEIENVDHFITNPQNYYHHVRFVDDPIDNPKFLLKYIHATELGVRNYFLPWLIGANDKSFREVLISQHEFMVNFGAKGYYVDEETLKDATQTAEDVLTGRFRYIDLDRAMHPIKNIGKDKLELRMLYVHIDNIPKDKCPKYMRAYMPSEQHLYHYHYPKPDDIEIYFEQMDILIKDIRDKLQVRPFDSNSKEVIIESIAKYYQLAVSGHIFDRVNNSLFMGQVNSMLRTIGHPPLAHEYLDFIAMTTNTDEFIKIFKDKINFPN